MIWKDPQRVVLAKYYDYFIEGLVTDAHRNVLWRLIALYASAKDRTWERQWHILESKLQQYIELVCIIGDFNDIGSSFGLLILD